MKDLELSESIVKNIESLSVKDNISKYDNLKLKNAINNISLDNMKKEEIINLVLPEKKILIELYLNMFEPETPNLYLLPNLFVLYNPIEKTILYNGRLFYKYKDTKASIENNYVLFRCKTYRHDEIKLKGKPKYCYGTIRLYDNTNPELVKFYMEQEHSIWCNTFYITQRNENLKNVLIMLNEIEDINLNVEDKKLENNKSLILKNKLLNYFNDKLPKTLTEVKSYCEENFSEYKNIYLQDNFLKNLYYPWKKNTIKFNFYSVFENIYTNNNKKFLRHVIYSEDNNHPEDNYMIGIIYGSDFHIKRLANAMNWFLDGTFIHPPEFSQILILMYLDTINFIYIPGLYAIINSKKEEMYDIVIKQFKNIITCNGKLI